MKGFVQGCKEERRLATYIDAPMRLSEVLSLRQKRSVDLALVVKTAEAPRQHAGSSIRNYTVMDDSGFSAELAVWGKPGGDDIPEEGRAFLAMNMWVIAKDGGVAISLPESRAVVAVSKNKRLEELESACAAKAPEEGRSATVKFVGGIKPIECGGRVTLACAAILDIVKNKDDLSSKDIPFQAMNVSITLNTPDVQTADGSRLFALATIRDWSGGTGAALVESALLQYLQVATKEEAIDKAKGGWFQGQNRRVNIRGACRGDQVYVAEVSTSSLRTMPNDSLEGLAKLVMLCGDFRDGNVVAKAKDVKSSGYANMMVSTIDDDLLPHRILLLAKGTEDTQLLPTANSESKARMLLSKNVKCLLSDESPNITMKGYASEVDLLKLALHEDFGLVTVSCISNVEPGSLDIVIDSITKIKEADIEAVKAALLREWELTMRKREQNPTRAAEEWIGGTAKKSRTIENWPSDPATPM
jgi:hypothetical protein